MITATDCYNKYGTPSKTNPFMTWWDVPERFEINQFPKKLWCNRDLIDPLSKAMENLINRGYIAELCTFDGCFNIRVIRGYESKYKKLMDAGREDEAAKLMSLHSWAVAVDLNAFENGLGKEPKLSQGFVQCFKDAGFRWGGDFARIDGMHFELSEI